jgi:hypothetical protein
MKPKAKPVKKGKKLGAIKPLRRELAPRHLLKEII